MNNNHSETETIKGQTQEIKAKGIKAVLKALDDYHYPCMGTDELKTIIANVIENKVETTFLD